MRKYKTIEAAEARIFALENALQVIQAKCDSKAEESKKDIDYVASSLANSLCSTLEAISIFTKTILK